MAVTQDRVLCVAGDEQHLQFRAQRLTRISQLPAIETAREAGIGDQQVDPDGSINMRVST